MARCIIFCAAAFTELLIPIDSRDYIIAADGGLKHLKKLRIHPHTILGDFYSLGYVPEDSQVFPAEKDDTDTMLAVKEGLSRGYRDFLFYGGLDGPRLDHTVANFQTLQYLTDHGAHGTLVGNTTLVTVIQKEQLRFSPAENGMLSVFSMGSRAEGVNIQGLQYPLKNGCLTCGFPLGVSNCFLGNPVNISVREGSLLIIWERKIGLPECEMLC